MSQHLGAEIKKTLKQRGMSVSEFARRINKSRENAYSIFKRKSLDTDLLKTISLVLEREFFYKASSRKSGASEEPRVAYTKVERELEFLREELIHMRKELQYLRDRIDKPTVKTERKYKKK